MRTPAPGELQIEIDPTAGTWLGFLYGEPLALRSFVPEAEFLENAKMAAEFDAAVGKHLIDALAKAGVS